jgi:hypothetical protein
LLIVQKPTDEAPGSAPADRPDSRHHLLLLLIQTRSRGDQGFFGFPDKSLDVGREIRCTQMEIKSVRNHAVLARAFVLLAFRELRHL